MRITNVHVTNFRLLRDVDLHLDDVTTVIVGRNNSGKTSLMELFRRFGDSPKFQLDDFSLGAYEAFWAARDLHLQGKPDAEVSRTVPEIGVRITLDYSGHSELGALSEFIIDLDATCATTVAVARYAVKDGAIARLFDDMGLDESCPVEEQQAAFFEMLRERIPGCFEASLLAEDPADPSNRKVLEWKRLSAVIRTDFINAQRGLDDTTTREHDVLGRVLERLFATAGTSSATPADQQTACRIAQALKDIQGELGTKLNKQLDALLPTFALFNYPSLPDPKLQTETAFDIMALLKNSTRIRYPGVCGTRLPETYNGLGSRNLIYILLALHSFFKEYVAAQPRPVVHLVFIEEPEAHLHPQMQEVFIEQLGAMAAKFEEVCNDGTSWPVQFAVSTHSSHIANSAPFKAIRYFLTTTDDVKHQCRRAKVKDLSRGLSGDLKNDEPFLHKYMTLTRCDLLFADKAILIEGASERILLPQMVERSDQRSSTTLATQYVSVIEVGGAHAHVFFGLLAFLELPTFVITDLDSVDADGEACMVSEGSGTSNSCIHAWFPGKVPLKKILKKTDEEKVSQLRRIAFQVPENASLPCGRSFEQAFVLANLDLFGLSRSTSLEEDSWKRAKKEQSRKVDFALDHLLTEVEWNVPKYIADGLRWLAAASVDPSCLGVTPSAPVGSQVGQ